VRQYIGAQMPPAPLLMAHQTQKIDKLVRYKVHIKITYWRAEQKEAECAYFHTNHLLTGLYVEETEIR
jgi:hypothetical protein